MRHSKFKKHAKEAREAVNAYVNESGKWSPFSNKDTKKIQKYWHEIKSSKDVSELDSRAKQAEDTAAFARKNYEKAHPIKSWLNDKGILKDDTLRGMDAMRDDARALRESVKPQMARLHSETFGGGAKLREMEARELGNTSQIRREIAQARAELESERDALKERGLDGRNIENLERDIQKLNAADAEIANAKRHGHAGDVAAAAYSARDALAEIQNKRERAEQLESKIDEYHKLPESKKWEMARELEKDKRQIADHLRERADEASAKLDKGGLSDAERDKLQREIVNCRTGAAWADGAKNAKDIQKALEHAGGDAGRERKQKAQKPEGAKLPSYEEAVLKEVAQRKSKEFEAHAPAIYSKAEGMARELENSGAREQAQALREAAQETRLAQAVGDAHHTAKSAWRLENEIEKGGEKLAKARESAQQAQEFAQHALSGKSQNRDEGHSHG